ncbi:DUF6287 domain-containing protein [Streptococcus tangpeifui]|uniref:DUF6287 domain-containing protein n=1 Tax=Streptococcus tangpeifui TaxID=2709400 RepID=UPI0013EA91F4|nr:DUF6287 domain-containing protein [Streptococcus sp. ZJ373]
MKKPYKFVAVFILGTTLFLTGCHKNSSQNETHSTSIKTSQTSKAKPQKGSSQHQSSSQVSSNNHDNGETTNPSSSTSQSSANSQVTSPRLDVTAIANGDFSSLVGTWQTANGDTLVFDNNGLVSDTQVISSQGVSGEKALFTIAPKDSEVGSAALYVIPAGVPTVGGKTYQQDALVVGQGESAEDTPYYRAG